MSALTAIVQIGSRPPLGGGIVPAVVCHCYAGGWPRFVAYEVRSDASGPALDRIPGAYAPEFDNEESYPLTDLLIATRPSGSAAADRIDVLSTKAAANYGWSLREKVFAGDVARGSPGYGRLFEARSQLETHPYEGVIVVSVLPGIEPRIRQAIRANADRLDATVEVLEAGSTRPSEG